jgi:hypothetical protein
MVETSFETVTPVGLLTVTRQAAVAASPGWILAAGNWDDTGVWDDSAVWID